MHYAIFLLNEIIPLDCFSYTLSSCASDNNTKHLKKKKKMCLMKWIGHGGF